MSAAKTLLSAQEFDQYPFEDDKRYELDEGELIEMTRPAYLHNRVLKNLQFALELYLRQNPVGEMLISENLFSMGPLTRLAPDVAVLLGDRRAELLDTKVIHIVPEIVAEVVSPSETTRRIHRKLGQYFQAGVKEVWLVYAEERSVEILTGHTPAGSMIADEGTVTSALLPGFALPLADLFA
jgi:Uma2 family endonuclease